MKRYASERQVKRDVSGALVPALRVALAGLLTLGSAAHAAAQITDTERQRLVAHLEMTAGWLADEISDLSQRQLEFRPSPAAWNILEVIEHLVVVGPIYWNDLRNALKTPARPVNLSSDADILWYGIDRTSRETARRSEDAPGHLRDAKSGLAAHRRHHTRLLEYIRTTTDDLRRHLVQRQQCDAYQWALLISTHEQRHILQIREIKRNPKFPAK